MLRNVKKSWIWLASSRRRMTTALLAMAFGLLLWSRLIMVSNLPRTAIAEDEKDSAPPVEIVVSDKDEPKSTQVNIAPTPKRVPPSERILPNALARPIDSMFREEGKLVPRESDVALQNHGPQRQELIKRIIERLHLGHIDSIAKTAVINGRRRTIGDRIEFEGDPTVFITLDDVRTNSVILDGEGRRFELNNFRP